jgi:hypothetical protein
VDSTYPGSSQHPARSKKSSRSPHGPVAAPLAGARTGVPAPDRLITAQSGTSIRRLVADERYFGLEARALRAGAVRVLARQGAPDPKEARIDADSLGADFRLDAVNSARLLKKLEAGTAAAGRHWRLSPDRTSPRICARLRYAVIACTARLLHAVRDVANTSTPVASESFEVKTVAVSGSYMSRRDPLPEFPVGGRRLREARGRHAHPRTERRVADPDGGGTPSSFIVVASSPIDKPFVRSAYSGGKRSDSSCSCGTGSAIGAHRSVAGSGRDESNWPRGADAVAEIFRRPAVTGRRSRLW